jgi:hypothetical protein
VRDDEVVAASDGALEYIERRHHRQGDSLYSCLRIACLERVDCRASHFDTSVLLDSRNDVSRSWCRLRAADAKRRDKKNSK